MRLFLLTIAFWLAACYYQPATLCEGPLRGRHVEDTTYVVTVVDVWGDSIDVATTRDVYMYHGDFYYKAVDGQDRVLRRRKPSEPTLSPHGATVAK